MNTLIVPILQEQIDEQITEMNVRRACRQQRKAKRRERMLANIDRTGARIADKLYKAADKIDASSMQLKKWFSKK